MLRFISGRSLRGTVRLILFGALVSILPACSSFSTYPPDGNGPRIYPWIAPGPEVMATGLRQAHARVAPDQPLVYNLPADISQLAWNDVQTRLGPDARAMRPGDRVVWNLERYGINNTRAFAEIGYWNEGKGVLVTVSMERENIGPFRVTHVQRWYVDMSEPRCQNPEFVSRRGDRPTEVEDATSDADAPEASDDDSGTSESESGGEG